MSTSSSGLIAGLPVAVYHRIGELGDQTHAETRRRITDNSGPIPTGQRTDTLKALALEQIREGVSFDRVLAGALELNQRCLPPLDAKLVARNVKGLFRWAAAHPTETERARAEARRILAERRAGTSTPLAPLRKAKRELVRRPLRSVVARPVEFLRPLVIPLRTLMLLGGVGGLGKSGLLQAWMANVTQAGRDVIIVSYEDAAEEVLRPRAEAVGVDLDRMHVLAVGTLEGGISFPTDLPELDRHVRETRAAAVLIDPVSAAIDLRLDSHKDQDVRVVLGQLTKLAERERLAVLMNAHLNKAPTSDPYLRINGSTAFYNAARSVLTVTRDPAEPDWHRLVAHHKSNYGPLADVERWRVVPVTLPSVAGPIETMKMEFVEIAEGVSRDDVLGRQGAGTEKLDHAVAFLAGALIDGDWHDSAGVKTLAGATGISKRTLERAAEELELDHERRGFPSSTWWRLPQSRQPFSQVFGATADTA